MYLINPDIEELGLITFHPNVQAYLVASGVPAIYNDAGTLYFRDTENLRKVISESPLWVRNIIGKEVDGFE